MFLLAGDVRKNRQKTFQRSILDTPTGTDSVGKSLAFWPWLSQECANNLFQPDPCFIEFQKSYIVVFCKFQSNMSQKSSQLLQLVNSMNRVEWRFSNLHFQKIFRTPHHLGITPQAKTQSQPHPHDWLRYQMNVFRGRWPRCCTFGLGKC